MESSALDETQYITEAILQSQPHDEISEPCNDIHDANMFYHAKGGFVGGKLFNIYTGALQHARTKPREPMIETPVHLHTGAMSTIGRLLVGTLNESLSKKSSMHGLVPTFSSAAVETTHFCNEAEAYYNAEFMYGRGKIVKPTLLFDDNEHITLYEKGSGHSSTIVMHENGIVVNNIWLPPGIICHTFFDDMHTSVSPSYVSTSTKAITDIAPLRASVFGIPKPEREQTFRTPIDYKHAGISGDDLHNYMTIDSARSLLLGRLPQAKAA